jgi:hypothetical protein
MHNGHDRHFPRFVGFFVVCAPKALEPMEILERMEPIGLVKNDPKENLPSERMRRCIGNYSAAEETAAVFPAVHRGSDNAGSRDYFKGKTEKLYGAKVTCW